jgi:phospholipase/carboxylesterase
MIDCHIIEHGTPQHCMIWLHGLGADGYDLAPLAEELRGAWDDDVRFVFPHAPRRPVTINGGYTMPAWYDIVHNDIHRECDSAGIHQSYAQIQTIIDEQRAQGMEHIILAGFSQGGAMAVYTGLRQSEPLTGIIALSCYHLLARETVTAEPLPIFIGHGDSDPIVPPFLGKDLRDAMQQQGHTVQWYSYPMEHSIHPQEIADICQWCHDLI